MPEGMGTGAGVFFFRRERGESMGEGKLLFFFAFVLLAI